MTLNFAPTIFLKLNTAGSAAMAAVTGPRVVLIAAQVAKPTRQVVRLIAAKAAQAAVTPPPVRIVLLACGLVIDQILENKGLPSIRGSLGNALQQHKQLGASRAQRFAFDRAAIAQQEFEREQTFIAILVLLASIAFVWAAVLKRYNEHCEAADAEAAKTSTPADEEATASPSSTVTSTGEVPSEMALGTAYTLSTTGGTHPVATAKKDGKKLERIKPPKDYEFFELTPDMPRFDPSYATGKLERAREWRRSRDASRDASRDHSPVAARKDLSDAFDRNATPDPDKEHLRHTSNAKSIAASWLNRLEMDDEGSPKNDAENRFVSPPNTPQPPPASPLPERGPFTRAPSYDEVFKTYLRAPATPTRRKRRPTDEEMSRDVSV